MDLFTLRIAKLNPPQDFTLKRLISLVFLGHHIIEFFIFLHQVICLHVFNLDLMINLNNYLSNSLGLTNLFSRDLNKQTPGVEQSNLLGLGIFENAW